MLIWWDLRTSVNAEPPTCILAMQFHTGHHFFLQFCLKPNLHMLYFAPVSVLWPCPVYSSQTVSHTLNCLLSNLIRFISYVVISSYLFIIFYCSLANTPCWAWMEQHFNMPYTVSMLILEIRLFWIFHKRVQVVVLLWFFRLSCRSLQFPQS